MGRALWEAGLVHFTAGNMSVRQGPSFLITRTGRSLSDLRRGDLIRVNLKDGSKDGGASTETPVHRALYKVFSAARAVVHAHPPYATALSFDADVIVPVDSDSVILPRVPVLTECPYGEGSACVAAKLPAVMKASAVGLIRGHGAFAVGDSLAQCVGRLTMMENQCRLLFLRRLLARA
jgi:L-fuculose-phosphate aldolase